MLLAMSEQARHIAVGNEGEALALQFLRAKGWRVLHLNWRPQGRERGLELDLVVQDGATLVFVEVKTRVHKAKATAISSLAAFTPRKQKTLVRAARHYLAAHDLWDAACRFDLVLVDKAPGEEYQVEHFCDVIEFGHIVDSGNTSWQPW